MTRTRIAKPDAHTPATPPAASQQAPAAEASPAPTAGRKRTSAAPAENTGPTPAAPDAAPALSPGALQAAKALAEELDREPELKLPFSTYPKPSEQLAGIVDTVIDQGEGVDLNAEFDALQKELEIVDALTPQVVRAHINRVEKNAQRAHRLFVLAKAQFETYRIHAETALGAMRDTSRAKLTSDKNSGKHAKQVTDQDVNDTAATLFPEEWADISSRLQRTKLTLEHLQRYADLWQRRSYSLSALNQ